jgi:hypothetical protein
MSHLGNRVENIRDNSIRADFSGHTRLIAKALKFAGLLFTVRGKSITAPIPDGLVNK